MKYKTGIVNCFLLSYDRKKDDRGKFSRLFCNKDLKDMDIDFDMVQTSISSNIKAGTMRGLHVQVYPKEENKIISCLTGTAIVAVVDLRGDSNTFKNVETFILSEGSSRSESVCVPRGCGVGYQTLEDNTTLLYMMDEYYDAEYQVGVNCLDKTLNIPWLSDTGIIMSEKDKRLQDLPV